MNFISNLQLTNYNCLVFMTSFLHFLSVFQQLKIWYYWLSVRKIFKLYILYMYIFLVRKMISFTYRHLMALTRYILLVFFRKFIITTTTQNVTRLWSFSGSRRLRFYLRNYWYDWWRLWCQYQSTSLSRSHIPPSRGISFLYDHLTNCQCMVASVIDWTFLMDGIKLIWLIGK